MTRRWPCARRPCRSSGCCRCAFPGRACGRCPRLPARPRGRTAARAGRVCPAPTGLSDPTEPTSDSEMVRALCAAPTGLVTVLRASCSEVPATFVACVSAWLVSEARLRAGGDPAGTDGGAARAGRRGVAATGGCPVRTRVEDAQGQLDHADAVGDGMVCPEQHGAAAVEPVDEDEPATAARSGRAARCAARRSAPAARRRRRVPRAPRAHSGPRSRRRVAPPTTSRRPHRGPPRFGRRGSGPRAAPVASR